MAERTIGVFTGSRAEYGLLYPVMAAIRDSDALDLKVVASGQHMAEDGAFEIAAHVNIAREDESPASTPRAIGAGVVAVADALERLSPDVFVVYGDRFEAFAAMIAATQMSLPTAHIEGGDLTQGGTLDDVVRHAMTKLAHVHLTTNAAAARRVALLGEETWRIHNVGFPTIDLIRSGDFSSPDDVVAALGLDLARPVVIFTQHPITTAPGAAGAQIAASLDALDRARTELGAQIVLTYPNDDLGSGTIIDALENWAGERADVVLRKSLGRRLYHGVLNVCGHETRGVCVGNSSSGVKETTAFHCPTVDVGPRQTGRLRGANVAHVEHDADAIFDAIRRSLTDDAYRAEVALADNPYGAGRTGPAVAEILAGLDLNDPGLVAKKTVLPGD